MGMAKEGPGDTMPGMKRQPQETSLTKQFIVAALSFVIALELLTLLGGMGILGRGGDNLASVITGVVATLTNTAREKESLVPLKESEVLALGAQMKANDMAARGYFAHTDPDGNPPWKWFQAAGYTYEYAGENLAVNFNDSEDVVDAWLASPTHRANIMKAEFSEIGIGIAEGQYKGKKATFVVQFFGKPSTFSMPAVSASAAALSAITPAEELLVSPQVLGTSTSVVERFTATPLTDVKMTLYGLVVLLLLSILFGSILRKKLPTLAPTILVLLVLAVLLGHVVIHKEEFFGASVEAAE